MRRSTERILTTHTGSLPRPNELTDLLLASDRGGAAFDAAVQRAVEDVVKQQRSIGIDIVNDGEQGKASFATYVTDRLTGFESEPHGREASVEQSWFPDYYAARTASLGHATVLACSGPIVWMGEEQVQQDIDRLRFAMGSMEATEVFMTAASPGTVWYYQPNTYYPSHEAYIYAAADAMRHEYEAIHRAGYLLQLDCPDLAGGWNRREFADRTAGDFRRMAQLHVEALNHATRSIPADRMRLHVCWGNIEGPHTRDLPLEEIIDILMSARPQALSIEAANPRHAHEWTLFQDIKLPQDKILIPGVLDTTSNFVEHPELVAQRIGRYASVIGRERVIAGGDCGFATLARRALPVHPTVVCAKLRSLVEGARLASETLWGHVTLP
ncbi:MAG TPA: cobalamin-independent methionine synthase II family protein [Dehalococcoidia bacterium]|nr:cobalamin-independent methionine synthase II family protein [Dehalococcoidia bacterium]